MAGSRVTIEVEDRLLLEALGAIAARANDLTPALRSVGEVVLEQTRRRIEAGGPAPDGTPWAPLSPDYLARKPQNKDKILILYGRLLGSIHPTVGHNEVSVGTNVVYAAAQQFGMRRGAAGQTRRGAPIPWGDIPARPFLGLSDADEREVLATLQHFLAP